MEEALYANLPQEVCEVSNLIEITPGNDKGEDDFKSLVQDRVSSQDIGDEFKYKVYSVYEQNPKNLDEENKALRRELGLLSEKFQLMQVLHQNQSKLIELFLRMEMIRDIEGCDQRETEDLQRKIQLCVSVIEEYNVKYMELCNGERRVVLSTPSEPEKKAAVWDHFSIRTDAEGVKFADCNFCGRSFTYKSLTANKCREHIYERCDKAPESMRGANKSRNDPSHKSRYNVWNYFTMVEKDEKMINVCKFCSNEYSSRNATKCREHLAFKCTRIDTDVRDQMRSTFSQDYINSVNTAKRSTIWEHFNINTDEETSSPDKMIVQCIYCCINYANKNATKCREHLLERCEKIPSSIRHRINNSFFETPLKTWTQVKVPIWKHFSTIMNEDRRHFKCNYCEKVYSSKNVTKFRVHLLTKCTQIPEEAKNALNREVGMSGKHHRHNVGISQNGERMVDKEEEEDNEDTEMDDSPPDDAPLSSIAANPGLVIKEDIDDQEEISIEQ